MEQAISMNLIRIVIAICFLLTDLLSFVYGNSENAFRESKIGGFDFSEKLVKNSQLTKKYGVGCRDSNDPDHYHRYYYFPDRNIYGVFDIGGVTEDGDVLGLKLTIKKITSSKCKARRNLKNYETGRKIVLGDKTKKVIKVYGKPSLEEMRENHIILYRYYVGREEGPYMEIEIQDDQVISIYVTVSD